MLKIVHVCDPHDMIFPHYMCYLCLTLVELACHVQYICHLSTNSFKYNKITVKFPIIETGFLSLA